MTDREAILEAIQDRPSERTTGTFSYRFAADDLWTEFEQRLESLGGRIIDRTFLNELAQRPKWVEASVSAKLGFASDVSSIWSAEVGISRGDFAIAQTGTLAVSAGSQTERLSTLVPPVNIVVVGRQDIVPTLREGIARLSDRTSVFITGPSRTADIEGVLVRGIHGPGELLVFIRD